MKPEDRLARIDRNVLNLLRWSIDIMTTQAEFQTQMDQLAAQGIEAKADAARQAAQVEQAVGLLQGLTQVIANLKAQQGPITQEQLDALGLQAEQALADMAAANTTRDAADATLQGGVTDNTPA